LRIDPPAVYLRLHNEGAIENYRKRPAFTAFRVLVGQLADTRFVRRWRAGEDAAYVFEFEKEGRPLLVAWTLNGRQADLEQIVPGCPVARIVDRDGLEVPAGAPLAITEKPVYIYRGARE
jgi:hypothetical protein